MSAKLSTITTQYRRFTKNQVLTEGNLNEVVDFFDDQDRLSRIYLSGVQALVRLPLMQRLRDRHQVRRARRSAPPPDACSA